MPMGSWNLLNKEIHFKQISTHDPLKKIIKEAFDMDFDVSGGWGYDIQQPIVLNEQTLPVKQLQHTLASIRMHLEMSMTLPQEQRYAGINLTELSRKTDHSTTHEAVTYQVSAILESDYAAFIAAYKEGYGTEAFDIEGHFHDRETATLRREVTVWYRAKR